jgi:uncharacterized paraquat-inducible protein A
MTTSGMSRVTVAYCPSCDACIRFHTLPLQGVVIQCPECRTRVEVIHTLPLELDWVDEPWPDLTDYGRWP